LCPFIKLTNCGLPDRNSTDITLDIYSQVAYPIGNGTVSYTIGHNKKLFMQATDPLCDFVAGGCPVKDGQIEKHVDFAKFMPIVRKIDAGNYYGQAVFNTDKGEEIMCLELNWDFK